MTIEKYRADVHEYWTNIYHLVATDVGDALTYTDSIVAAERPLYTGAVTITKGRVDDALPNTDVSAVKVFNVAGTRTPPLEHAVPLFVVARVDFTVLGGGRPSRKYLRSVFYEADISFTIIEAPVKALLQTYANAVCSTGMCDVDNQAFVVGVPFPAPAMRQLRRGSKKKKDPLLDGIPL